MKTQHTPTPYRIGKIDGTNTWTVGKDNSLTEVFYFDHPQEAIAKYADLYGYEKVVHAVNSHEALLKALIRAKDHLIMSSQTDAKEALEQVREAIEQAEGKGE